MNILHHAARGLLAGAFLFVGMLSANAQLSSYTKAFLAQRQKQMQANGISMAPAKTTISPRKNAQQAETVQCFVSLNRLSTAEIAAKGGEVHAVKGGIALVTLPIDSIEGAARLSSVRQINVQKPVHLLSDDARVRTYAEDVQTLSDAAQAAGLSQKYSGKGVVLGIIDDGIEFNHTAFKDANGNTRVKAVYMPNATKANGGSQPVVDGDALPGYEYTTAELIGALTTDDTAASHGSHTTGCAGGSLIATTGLTNNTTYGGMAPEVDLVLCGLGQSLNDTSIAASALYIADYAKQHNQPCVISISLGSNQGPHDGTSGLCQYYDAIAEEYGAVILLATGNEADDPISITKTITETSNHVATIIAPTSDFTTQYGSYYYVAAENDIWNSTSDALEIEFVVLKGSTLEYTTGRMDPNHVDLSGLSTYFDDSVLDYEIEGGVNSANNRYNIYTHLEIGKATGNYKLGMVLHGKTGNTITMWNDNYYSQYASASSSDYTFTKGDGTASLCDDVTGQKTISVGAYASRLKDIPYSYGSKTGSFSNSTFGAQNIAYFSSYGTDFNGVQHPFVAAPGHTVISSVNRHDTSSITKSDAAYRLKLQGATYDYWMYMSGTSMATPVAAGVVCLYMQAEPKLTVDNVKEVITNSATTDSYTSGTYAKRFGAGKINALEGIKYILTHNPTGINETPNTQLSTLNSQQIYTLDGRKVSGQSADGQLPRGIYIQGGRKFVVR